MPRLMSANTWESTYMLGWCTPLGGGPCYKATIAYTDEFGFYSGEVDTPTAYP